MALFFGRLGAFAVNAGLRFPLRFKIGAGTGPQAGFRSLLRFFGGGTPASSNNLTIVKTFDTTTGSRASPGSAFGANAVQGNGLTLSENFFNSVDEACGLLEAAFCKTPFTMNVQFGYGTCQNFGLDAGVVATNTSASESAVTYANWKAAVQSKIDSAAAQTAFDNFPATISTTNVSIHTPYSIWLGFVTNPGVHLWVGISKNHAWTWTKANGIAGGTRDAVGSWLHEITEGGMGRCRNTATFGVQWVMNVMAYDAPGSHDYTADNDVYLSIDGGTTNLFGAGQFLQTSRSLGDLATLTSDVSGPSQAGVENVFSTATKTLMDALGWQATGS